MPSLLQSYQLNQENNIKLVYVRALLNGSRPAETPGSPLDRRVEVNFYNVFPFPICEDPRPTSASTQYNSHNTHRTAEFYLGLEMILLLVGQQLQKQLTHTLRNHKKSVNKQRT